MTRRDVLTAVAAAPALLSQARKKRNLVLIISDDHRYDAMGFMGHPWLKTPSLDRMAGNGVHFRNAFVTTSLCSPSRACVLTGQYVHAHGVADNVSALPDGLATYPRTLQQQGYKTAMIGKWHMGGDSDEPRPGFDHWASFRGQGAYRDPVLNRNGTRAKVDGYVTDVLTDETCRFIRSNKDRPFCVHLGHKAVHAEFIPADRHKDRYTTEAIPYPKSMANTEENYRGKPDWVRRQRNSWHGVDGLYNKTTNFDQFYRDYCRTVLALDESVGRILTELEETGLANDTLVVYLGDNGFQFGEYGLIDKRTMYEPSIRIPMMAQCPDLFPKGGKVDEMALNIDVGCTLLEAAGAPAMPKAHGRSFLGLARNDASTKASWRKDFVYEYFWERDFPQTPTVIGLRTDQYSFMQYHGVWDLDELYDVKKDPDQMNNLMGEVRTTTEAGRLYNRIRDPQLKTLVTDLQDRLFKSLEQTGGRREPRWA